MLYFSPAVHFYFFVGWDSDSESKSDKDGFFLLCNSSPTERSGVLRHSVRKVFIRIKLYLINHEKYFQCSLNNLLQAERKQNAFCVLSFSIFFFCTKQKLSRWKKAFNSLKCGTMQRFMHLISFISTFF